MGRAGQSAPCGDPPTGSRHCPGSLELLLRRMQGDDSPVEHLELRATVVLRESVRKPPPRNDHGHS